MWMGLVSHGSWSFLGIFSQVIASRSQGSGRQTKRQTQQVVKKLLRKGAAFHPWLSKSSIFFLIFSGPFRISRTCHDGKPNSNHVKDNGFCTLHCHADGMTDGFHLSDEIHWWKVSVVQIGYHFLYQDFGVQVRHLPSFPSKQGGWQVFSDESPRPNETSRVHVFGPR